MATTTTTTTTTTTAYYDSSAPVTHIELDLSTCQRPSSITDRINDAVPGLKTGTAFFHFLRANLALQPSGMSSNASTPVLEPQGLSRAFARPSPLGRTISSASVASSSSSSSKRPASPQRRRQQQQLSASAAATSAPTQTGLDDIPPLSLDVLTSRNDKVDALKLIADSIAQQRQRAAYNLIFHPVLLAALALALGVAYQFAWARRPAHDRDLGLAMTLTAAVLMIYLFSIRYATVGYIHLAEALQYDFLLPPSAAASDSTASLGDEDIVIGTRYGSEIIGACVLRLEPAHTESAKSHHQSSSTSSYSSSPRKNRHNRHNSLRGGKGVIRAWTVRLRYRGKGVGADMLHEAVRITRERCGRDAEVGFAAEHANSGVVLPEMLNRPFRQAERRAAGALEKVLGEWEGMKRKR